MVDAAKFIKLSRKEFDPTSTLSFQPEYYECSVCMSIPEDFMILECPVCSCHACRKCLEDYTSKSKKVPHGNHICVICHKDFKMKKPNKMMIALLEKVYMFECL